FSLGYKDMDCAFKLFKKASFECLDIKSNDFLFNAELLAKAKLKRLRIVQLGVEHYPRHGGESTISYKHILLTLKKLFFLYRELKDFRRKESPK
ncbi:MAG: glycosyltransferase family 2 protein, partial [Deltaproteobacteria bacterium]|nr:glycosyltransferase family 2 protein [Deltaproteobacteria bacterium]